MATLEEIIGQEEKETPVQPLESEKAQEQEKPEDNEVGQKEEKQLANVRKAIAEANAELKQLRALKKAEKAKSVATEEDLPTIDLSDPSAQAWDKHIRENVNPLQVELESGKQEIRTFALQQFLADKPSLSANPEKVKELMGIYNKIHTATERTVEGVLLDLNKSYAALHSDELLAAARGERIKKAQTDSVFSDIAVSRGASSYQSPKKETMPELSEEDRAFILKMGYSSIQEWFDDYKKSKVG